MALDTPWYSCFNRVVVRRGLAVALIVGPVLAAINHADKFIQGSLTGVDVLKIIITFTVPFTVSCVSSILSMCQHSEQKKIRALQMEEHGKYSLLIME